MAENHAHSHSEHSHSHSHAGHNHQAAPNAQNAVTPSLGKVKHIIAVASGKGGVGKSTVTVNLAYAFAAQGAKVGILDTDVYGPSIPGMVGLGDFRLTNEHQLPDGRIKPVEARKMKIMSLGFMTNRDTPVIWRGPMASQLVQQFLGGVEWGELDYLFIDMPPGTGDIQLTLSQAVPMTGAVIVTTPQEVAYTIAEKGLKMFQTVQVPILGIVENMSYYHCPECGHDDHIFQEGGGQKAAESLELPLLGQIPLNGDIAKSGDTGVPLIAQNPDSELSKSYNGVATQLTKEVLDLMKLESENPVLPSKVEMTDLGLVHIQWQDQTETLVTPRSLRQACPCASCVEEFTGKQLLDPATVSADIKVQEITPVGRYALRFAFSDGHGTGLYTFSHVRKLGEEKPAQPEQAEFEV